MYIFDDPHSARKLSYGSLIDLSEKSGRPENAALRPRIAIVGGGITGISTACHILDAGLDCQIFEAGGEGNIGGIWTRVNDTSSLQIHSRFYRFHPAVTWRTEYPRRNEILGQVQKLWHSYGLRSRTTFNCPVNSTYQEDDGKWVVNSTEHGYFDGIVAAVGTCGEAYTPAIVGQDQFEGQVVHSAELNREAVKGRNVLIVGGGASAVEALEFACDNGAATAKILSRSERWVIPRRPMLNACLAGTIGDRYGILAYVLGLIVLLFYGEFVDMAPQAYGPDNLFSGTPIVNSRIFELMRQGKASWTRGDVLAFAKDGIRFSRRLRGSKIGAQGQETVEKGDLVVLATGFRRPSLSFLPESQAGSKYSAPNWYLQTFPTENATICATNCTWQEGIGSVGGYHIGIYTRFLLVFLMDPSTKPAKWMMTAWVDLVHLLKKPYPGGALSFVTSAELFFWFLAVIVLQPQLWRWMSFILSGPAVLHPSEGNSDLQSIPMLDTSTPEQEQEQEREPVQMLVQMQKQEASLSSIEKARPMVRQDSGVAL